jgi:hypothetical protein
MASSTSGSTLHQRLAEVATAHPQVCTTFWSLSQSSLTYAALRDRSAVAA